MEAKEGTDTKIKNTQTHTYNLYGTQLCLKRLVRLFFPIKVRLLYRITVILFL